MAQSPRDGGNENGTEINANDDSSVSQHTAGTGHDDAGHRGVQNILHFRIGRHERFDDDEHLMKFSRVGAKKAEEVPEKEKDKREGEKQLISELRGQTGRPVGSGLPDQTLNNSADEA